MRPSPSARLVRSLGLLALAGAIALLLGSAATTAAAGQSAPVAHMAAAKKTTKGAKRKKRPSALTRCLRKARKAHTKKARAARRRACLRAARKAKKKARVARRKAPAPAPPPPPSGTNAFGSDVFGMALGGAIQNEDSTTLGRDLDSVQGTHTHWVRIDINWAQIQASGPSSYNWGAIDRVVQGATARGIKVLAIIVYTPGWARPSGTAANYGPDPNTYANFAATAVRHYAALGVHAYEVWNEPNQSGAWTPRPDPAAYTRLLQAAYPAIKGADPTATVLSGGTSPAVSDGTQIAPVDFLQGIYANGGGGYFDAVAHHPYCIPAYPGETQSWNSWYQMYGTNPSLRSVMIAHGDGAKKIWATEFGAPTGGPNAVSEATQASMLTRAYQLYRSYDWAGPLFFYEGRDYGTDPSTNENFFGLTHYDFTPKPAYTAYQQAATS